MNELTFPRMVYSDKLAPQYVEYGWGCKLCNTAEEWEQMKKKGWVLHPDDLNMEPAQFAQEPTPEPAAVTASNNGRIKAKAGRKKAA